MMAQLQQEKDRLNLAPKKFNMWIFIFTSFMFFAALTSAFIVYSGSKGHALSIILPKAFMYSTAILVASSVTLFFASKAAKGLQLARQRLLLSITMGLGMVFFAVQIYAWYILTYKMGIYFTDPNASRTFVFVMSGMHLLHIIGGLIFLGAALTGSIKRIPQVRNIYRMEMASIFWHFLDIIWIYLYVFLLLNQY